MSLGPRGMLMGGVFRPETVALLARMSGVAYSRKVVINRLVTDLVAADVWDDHDAFYIFAGDASVNSLISWKDATYNASNNGATFTADRGFTGDGVSAYISPGGYGPGSGQWGQNDHSYWAWVRTAGTGTSLGCNSGAATYSQIDQSQGIDGASGDIVSYGGDTGLLANSRTLSTEWNAYRNGAAVGTRSTSNYTTPSNQIRILSSRNSVGSEVFFSTAEVAAAGMGKGLNATKMAALYAALNRYMTSVGAV